ncbi:hypothetical protein O0I10_008002 [Lichtheimia ornata]|uniref:Uncharacterized protein n=1 Tax=Lichtheimia ornata TaxID=688661 RepID=A0AAD7UYW3_9FUNG|nr:uncharacterized protein O0I10_008002 [Lichtheimia ornata]KAJ8656208.1 hypothetical protein O0I10_008002 [Lichtheimia ornata]
MSTALTLPPPQQQQQGTMADAAAAAAAAPARYKSLLSRPARLFQRSNKTAPLVDATSPKPMMEEKAKMANKKPKSMTLALRENSMSDVFKLSTINGSGEYLPPSPCEDSKRDHWLDVDQDELAFRLPSTDRLTKENCFFTPSATM